MTQNRIMRMVTPVAVVLGLALAAPAFAQRGGGGHATAGARGGGGPAVGSAVPRGGAAPYRGGFGYGGYRGYGWYRGYGGLYFGLGYPGFYAWGYPWYGYPWYGGYAYPYYGYPAYGNLAYGYPYGAAARPYGSVRIDLPQKDAEVYADGYFTGNVDDFDGRFHHLNLEPGPHRIEVRAAGFEPITFDVNVEPGQTVTYRAAMRPAQP